MALSGRHLYETAFDSRGRPSPPEGPDDLLETTRRLCGPAPPGRGAKRSPGGGGQRPKKLLSPSEAEGKINDVRSGSAEAKSPNKDDHFSPSVEFKKLDFGGDENNSVPEVPHAGTTAASGGDLGQEEPSAPAQTTRQPFDNGVSRSNLWLDFSRAAKRPRRHLALGIGAEGVHSAAAKPVAHLLKQGWYHGSISRADADNLLRLLKKGSFLVRSSEKLKRHYLLSLKSTRGVVHVKIVQLPNGKHVIRQQSQSFESIPHLIQYFSSHVLNIHEMNVYLSHPVIEKLL